MSNNKWRGIRRDKGWQPEPPEAYGIQSAGLRLPTWFADGVGYPYKIPFFGVFSDGQWFNGKREGQGRCLLKTFAALVDKLGIEGERCALFCYQQRQERWISYIGEESSVLRWLELHAQDYVLRLGVRRSSALTRGDIRQRLEALLDEAMTQQNRLLMYLNNVQRHQAESTNTLEP